MKFTCGSSQITEYLLPFENIKSHESGKSELLANKRNNNYSTLKLINLCMINEGLLMIA